MTFLVSHFDKSGKDDKDSQLANILLISKTLFIFHLDISGKENNDLQLENILLMLVI